MRSRVALSGFLVVILLVPTLVFAWGSVYPARTHQHILTEVWRLIQADPAFSGPLFPLFTQVEAYEGVEWTETFSLVGNGPDADGATLYSQHYYNPVTKEGNGPKAAAQYYGYQAKGIATGNAAAAAKAAAWSAHFLADMFVPYHVNGAMRATVLRLLAEAQAKHPGVTSLGHNITGSYRLNGHPRLDGPANVAIPFDGGIPNFYTVITRWRDLTAPDFDWFDPWYYDGNLHMSYTSSHVLWEAAVRHQTYGLSGYAREWTNAAPTFTDPWTAHAGRVEALAIQSATETRQLQEAYLDNPAHAVDKAIQAVYTMWRSTFSGLRPTLAWTPNPDGTYAVTGTLTNAANAEATSLKVRLTVSRGTIVGPAEQALDRVLPKGGTTKTLPWTLKPVGGQPCKLKLEVIGAYAIPDLQYAVVERDFTPQSATLPAPPSQNPPTSTGPTPSTPAAPVPPAAESGHWERGAASVRWSGPPQKSNEGGGQVRTLGPTPQSGDHWHSDGPWQTRLDAVSSSHVAASIHDDRGAADLWYRADWSWGEPPAVLTPGQTVQFALKSSASNPSYGIASLSMYVYTGNENSNKLVVNAPGPNQTATGSYTIPTLREAGGNPATAQFGFFCGNLLKIVYAYRWVGGAAPASPTTAQAPVGSGAGPSTAPSPAADPGGTPDPAGIVPPTDGGVFPPPPPPPTHGPIVNLALHKPATQSSIYQGTGIDQGPQFGNDGIRDSQPRDPYLLVITGADNPPWWQVDLEGVHRLTQLKLYNRKACCQEKAKTVQVLLSTDGTHWERAYAHNGTAFDVLTVDLTGRSARYVRIQLAERVSLHFQECEVYGY